MEKTHYVLIDYENVQAIDLDRVKNHSVKVIFFVGTNQKSVPMTLFRKSTEIPGVVEVVESIGNGKNALDFQMACYAGRLAESKPDAYVHIVSKDKGFDVVVKYLRLANRLSARVDCFDELSFLGGAKLPNGEFTLQQKFEQVLTRLSKTPAVTRPRKSKTLLSCMNAMFNKQLPDLEAKALLDRLVKEHKILISETQGITYKL